MSGGHTPGPWKVIETTMLGHSGDHVADMSNGLMVIPIMSQLGSPLADARLVAAAPELLEALIGYIKAIAQGGGSDKDLFMACIREADNKARDAVAKATGAKP